jgi:predicted Zn-ribbon and HTH transcriptional regulator
MSADNWTVCPKCQKEVDKKYAKEKQFLASQYGKISAYAFVERSNAFKNMTLKDTLREDYEIGIYEGEFYIRYSGCCSKCGYEFKYDYKQKIYFK